MTLDFDGYLTYASWVVMVTMDGENWHVDVEVWVFVIDSGKSGLKGIARQ